jgi:hypothetical protein
MVLTTLPCATALACDHRPVGSTYRPTARLAMAELKFIVLFSRFATAESEQSINKRYRPTAVAVVSFNIFSVELH